jgi:hypothetical protein
MEHVRAARYSDKTRAYGLPFSNFESHLVATRPMIGAGVAWRFAPKLSLRLDGDRNIGVGRRFHYLIDGACDRFDYIDAITLNDGEASV